MGDAEGETAAKFAPTEMADDLKKIVLLGCTGSIGDTCFKVLENLGDGYEIVGLGGGTKVEKLIGRAHRWQPQKICVLDAEARKQVQDAVPRVEIDLRCRGAVRARYHAGGRSSAQWARRRCRPCPDAGGIGAGQDRGYGQQGALGYGWWA